MAGGLFDKAWEAWEAIWGTDELRAVIEDEKAENELILAQLSAARAENASLQRRLELAYQMIDERNAQFLAHSMPAKQKLDAVGIDVSVESLPSWEKIPVMFDPFIIPGVKQFAKDIAFEAMWRTAQQLLAMSTASDTVRQQYGEVDAWREAAKDMVT